MDKQRGGAKMQTQKKPIPSGEGRCVSHTHRLPVCLKSNILFALVGVTCHLIRDKCTYPKDRAMKTGKKSMDTDKFGFTFLPGCDRMYIVFYVTIFAFLKVWLLCHKNIEG